MTVDDRELEVKYYIGDLSRIIELLERLGASIIKPRIHEFNLRFDTKDRELTNHKQILRLRKDTNSYLTFKGPGESDEGVLSRQEIEFTIGDFTSAHNMLSALGFQVLMIYEKYRTLYKFDSIEITLDEMPYGDFIEIEAASVSEIINMSRNLGLDWEKRILVSYTELFDQLCERLGLKIRDLVFDEFKKIDITEQDLGVQHADVDQV